jgi:hypothetical protein
MYVFDYENLVSTAIFTKFYGVALFLLNIDSDLS